MRLFVLGFSAEELSLRTLPFFLMDCFINVPGVGRYRAKEGTKAPTLTWAPKQRDTSSP